MIDLYKAYLFDLRVITVITICLLVIGDIIGNSGYPGHQEPLKRKVLTIRNMGSTPKRKVLGVKRYNPLGVH